MAYLGETPVDVKDSPFRDYTPVDLAMHIASRYGQIDGGHHKTWVIDQMARCLKGAPIVNLRLARWDDHPEEWRFEIGDSPAYHAWVEEMKGGTEEDGSREYAYDIGIAP